MRRRFSPWPSRKGTEGLRAWAIGEAAFAARALRRRRAAMGIRARRVPMTIPEPREPNPHLTSGFGRRGMTGRLYRV